METFTAADRICLGAEVSGEIPATNGGVEPSAYLHKQLDITPGRWVLAFQPFAS